MFSLVFATFFIATAALLNSSAQAHPSLAGLVTNKNNNPAFQCNQVNTRGGAFQNVIVEARLNKWRNEDDDTYKSEDCENAPLDRCDMNIAGYIDVDTPTAQWLSPQQQLTEILHEWDGNDVTPNNAKYQPGNRHYSYTLCRAVKQLTLANVRIALDDLDFGGTVDKVNDMNCYWAPSKIGMGPQNTPWETINCCTRYVREMDATVRHELAIDVRAFYDDGRGYCPASGRRN